MHRHFIETEKLLLPMITLAKEEARHLQTVLRLRMNDEVELFDGRGVTVLARVVSAERNGMTLSPVAAPVRHAPHACKLVLFVCVSKAKRMDWTVEKAVELGASQIVPVISARTIVRLDDEDDAEGKTERWQRIAIEAARQSGTAWLPEISAPITTAEACAQIRAQDRATTPTFVAALSPDAIPMKQALTKWRSQNPATAGWFVGPEGDFTPEELQQVIAAGAIPVSLGHQILRAETAAIWGLCVLGAEWG